MSSQFARAAAAAGAALLAAPAAPALVPAAQAAAQAPVPADVGTVRGRVIESGSQRPVADAQVVVTGTTVGAVTNATGEYVLPRVPAGQRTVRVRRIGFGAVDRTVTVAAGAEVRLDVAISQSATSLEQVVVTGTAQATTRRTLGNSVVQLEAADLVQKSSLANVTDLLQSKTPGVILVPGSGTAGTAADIRIRGTSSLSASNRPIVFIDGVRLFDGGAGNFGPSGAGTGGSFSQGVSALDQLNPNDIESLEVIKGPAAATLYGADAAGGVIQIITKKGARSNGRVSWAGRYEGGGSRWALERITNYTTCTQVRKDSVLTAGQRAGSPLYPGCQGVPVNSVITASPLDDPQALRTGNYRNGSLNARGGSERFTFFVSGDQVFDAGVLRNNSSERTSGRANFGYNVTEKLDLQVNGGYVRQRLRLPLGDDAGGGLLISAVRGRAGLATYNSFADTNTRSFRLNLPEVANQYDNRLDSDRFTTAVTGNWRPLSWVRARATTGLDYYSPQASIYYAPGSVFSSGDFPAGFLAQRNEPTRVFTFDYAASAVNKLPFGPALTSEFTLGAQGIKTRTNRLTAEASGLPSPDLRLLQNATTVNATSLFTGQSSLGYYAQEQVGVANRLFVTGALRLDNNSAFGSDIKRILYPKLSLSYVASEEPALASAFRAVRADNVKFRFAYGEAGRAPLPFSAQRTYTSSAASRVVQGNGSVVAGLIPSSPGNPDLKAERGVEIEGGAEASFLDGRLGVDFTAYNKRTYDALVSLSNAPSTGFTGTRLVNFGALRNTGVELQLRATPVRARSVTWDAIFNLSTNNNEVTRLNQAGVTQLIPFNPYAPTTSPTQLIREGTAVADFYVVDAKRNADGTVQLVNNALVLDTLRRVGAALPTRQGSISNTLTLFRDLRLYALVDFAGGNYMMNQKARNRAQTANRNDLRFNDPSRPLSTADSLYWSSLSVTAPWIEPADFVKLRDVSVSYQLPARLLRARRVSGAQVVVAAHNVGFLSKKYSGIDPEVNFFGQGSINFIGNSNFTQFIRTDSFTLPMMRRITAALLVNF